ncbi:hypothetical protein MLD38_030993 [Melastoma candidum]|uniref:Uncharacterized protein n=1 Tax=Melastoma candidum TaxID=119954 RepID=A0ACB9MNC9_9MYRT|nr:hypothetical protein MLD38_030993 [Melastoma candidum]
MSELAICWDGESEPSLLDLPKLTLECVLEKLPTAGLCSMSAVCSSLRVMCRSDRLWEKHVELKWGRVIGEGARVEWEGWVVAESRGRRTRGLTRRKALWDLASRLRGFSWIRDKSRNGVEGKGQDLLPPDSVMSPYLSLESNQLCFPAQVYNRENGHSGFMLSCYGAHICYDSLTEKFRARYSSQGGRQTVEDGIPLNRIRSPPEFCEMRDAMLNVDTYLCIAGFGAGRMATYSMALEFNHYPIGSRWRKVVNRKKHPEEGDQVTGFYGRIRKLKRIEEITKWKNLWSSRVSL